MNRADSVAALLADATQRLAAARELEPQEARIEARVLLAHALNVDHAWLIGHDRDIPSAEQNKRITTLIERRIAGEPVAYILGYREFYGRRFKVTADVLIPRPETELLVEAALERLPKDRPARILDLGTGSGCIAISLALERPDCSVCAVDFSPAALAIATDNAKALSAQVEFLRSDWFSTILNRKFELIVSNPPYIEANDRHLKQGDLPYEPISALASGANGLDAIQRIAAAAPHHLTPDGALLLEHGWQQSDTVQSLLKQSGFKRIEAQQDLAGIRRIVIAAEVSTRPSPQNAITQ